MMQPVFRCSSTKDLQVSILRGFIGYILAIFGTKSGFRSMTWSYGRCGGSFSWDFSEKTSSKSLHHSGSMVSVSLVFWAIWVKMVTFPIVSPESQASLLLSHRAVLRSASIPSHRRMYLWGIRESVQEGRHSRGGTTSLLPISLGMEICLLTQSMTGFHFLSQGMPKMICFHPRFKTISLTFSRCLGNWRSTLVFQIMLPLELVIPSTLYALTCLSSFFMGNSASATSSGSMKLPVAPQLMMAEVSMIWLFTKILTGIRKVLSFGRAVNTWFTQEDDIEISSRFKNPGVLQKFPQL